MSSTIPATPKVPSGGYSVTLSEVVRLALPSGSEVLIGARLLERRVFWARLLGPRPSTLGPGEAGEVVLVGMAAAVSRAFARLVSDLGDAGVGAFIVSGDPPEDGLLTAEATGIPVIKLPEGASLVDAERSIISLIVDREAQVRRRVEQIYERLLATLIDDTGTGALGSELHDVTGRTVVVLDEYFRVQVARPETEATRALGQDLGSELSSRDPQSFGGRVAAPFTIPASVLGQNCFVSPLRLRDTAAGYLALIGETDISDLDRQIAERAARVLGIELAKQRAVTEAQLQIQGDFLDDLLSGNYPSEDAMLARGRWMGHDLASPHVALAVAVEELHDAARAGGVRRPRTPNVVRTEVVRFATNGLIREHEDTLVIAIPRHPAPDRQEAIGLGDRLRSQITNVLGRAIVTVGVGRSHPGVTGLTRAYREAEQALAIARSLLGPGQTVHFEDLGVQRLLFQLRENDELASFYEDLLGRLQAHDERQGAELVNTLEAFFECHGNHVRTAQRLHLHRNTLLYRLERARQVLDLDLDKAEARLALQVALKIGRVIGRRPNERAAGPREGRLVARKGS